MSAELLNRASTAPSISALESLFHELYAVSLRTEEGEPITVQIVFIDPENPDPDPPKRIVADRWRVSALEPRLPLEARTLCKLAPATDPRTSSLAIYADSEDAPYVWGMIDTNRYFEFMNFEADSGPESPGLFQARVEGPAHISVWIGYDKIGELRVSGLIGLPVDALREGPVLTALEPGISRHIDDVKSSLPEGVYAERGHWDGSLAEAWIAALSRVLLRARNYRHGGAVLLTPGDPSAGLRIKYALDYGRLRTALAARAATLVEKTHARDLIFADHLDPQLEEMPVGLHLAHEVARFTLDDIESELVGAIWFVSLLTRVDGLVLMTPDLEVLGFGVEITVDEHPAQIEKALDTRGSEDTREAVDYDHFGTRHRSMMRYCANCPGSVGFVMSQDGDVRVMTQVDGRLVMWDNVRLQLLNFSGTDDGDGDASA